MNDPDLGGRLGPPSNEGERPQAIPTSDWGGRCLRVLFDRQNCAKRRRRSRERLCRVLDLRSSRFSASRVPPALCAVAATASPADASSSAKAPPATLVRRTITRSFASRVARSDHQPHHPSPPIISHLPPTCAPPRRKPTAPPPSGARCGCSSSPFLFWGGPPDDGDRRILGGIDFPWLSRWARYSARHELLGGILR